MAIMLPKNPNWENRQGASLAHALGGLTDMSKSFINLTSTMMKHSNRRKLEVAQTELQSQALAMEKFEDEMLQNFSGRTDYENFEAEWNDAYLDFYNEYNTKGGENSYSSSYTQQKGNQLLEQMKTSGDIKISHMVNQGERNWIYQEKQSNIDKINDMYAPGQARLEMTSHQLKDMRDMNLITEDQYAASVKEQLNLNTYEATYDTGMQWVQENAGKNIEDLESYLNTLKVEDLKVSGTYHKLDEDGNPLTYSITVDRDEILGQVKKNIMQAVTDQQDKNNTALFATNTQILQQIAQGDDATVRGMKGTVLAQIGVIQSLPTMQISEKDRRARLQELNGIFKLLDKEVVTPKDVAKAKTQSYETFLKEEMDRYIQMGLNGEFSEAPGVDSLYTARDAFMNVAKETYRKYNLSDSQAELDFMSDFIDKAMRGLNLNEDVKACFNNLEKDIIQYMKKDDPAYEELYADATKFLWDTLFTQDISQMESSEVQKIVNKHLELLTGKELAIQKTKDNKGWYDLFNVSPYTANSEKDIAKGIYELATNDLAYTDTKGVKHADERVMENLNNELIPAMYEILMSMGVQNVDVKSSSVLDDNGNDITLKPVFADRQGNTYTFNSSDGKTYTIMKQDKNGNSSQFATSEAIGERQKALSKEEKEKLKQAKEQMKADREKALAEQNKEYAKIDMYIYAAASLPTIPAPPHVKQEKWAKMNKDKKVDTMLEVFGQYPEEFKKYMEKNPAAI